MGDRSGLATGGALCARPGAGIRINRTAAANEARSRNLWVSSCMFIVLSLCHDTGVMTSTMAVCGGAAVRRARLARALPQDELGPRAGLSRQALSAIESGAYQPGVGAALALARELGHSVEALFGRSAEPTLLEVDWAEVPGDAPAGAAPGTPPS